jgi:outer membrane lipoprotein-sorting protein
MRLFTVVLALTSSLAVAADAPDAQALIAESSKALFHQQPYRMQMHNDVRMQSASMNQTIAMDMKISVAPGRFRMDMSPAPMSATFVSDGQFTYFYLAAMKKYMKKPAAGSPEAFAESLVPGMSSMMGQANQLSTAKIVREETLSVGDLKRACFVVEYTIDKLSVTKPVPITIGNVRATMWIDKERKLSLKQTTDAEMQMGGPSTAPMKMHQETAVTSLDLAPAFAADEFTFTPPDGAEQVDSLPGMPQS